MHGLADCLSDQGVLVLLIFVGLIFQIASLTNEYFHLVPVGGFVHDAIRPIRDKKVLKEHFRLVSDLMDMEVASKILVGTQRKLTGMPALLSLIYSYKRSNFVSVKVYSKTGSELTWARLDQLTRQEVQS